MKKILYTIIVLFFFGWSTPAFAQVCDVKSDDCANLGKFYECSTNVSTYCCATQNDCHNLQVKEGTTKPIGPASPLPVISPSPSTTPQTVAFGITYCDAGASKISTAIGCIPVRDTNGFISFVIGWFVGISGGIAFLFIVWSGFQIMTAAGNPEQLQQGRETLTSAISGLILIIFSVFLLKLIGINILGIPGWI